VGFTCGSGRACRLALAAPTLHHSREPHPMRKGFFKDQNPIFLFGWEAGLEWSFSAYFIILG